MRKRLRGFMRKLVPVLIILTVLACGSKPIMTLDKLCAPDQIICDKAELDGILVYNICAKIDSLEIETTKPPKIIRIPTTEIETVQECVTVGDFPFIYFPENSFEILTGEATKLIRVMKTLQQCPEVDILITGHCDERLSDSYNYNLGLQRSGKVASWFRGHGIAGNRILNVSKGKSEPFAKGHAEDFYRLNRRVEITLR